MALPEPLVRILISRWFGVACTALFVGLLGMYGYRMWKRTTSAPSELNISCFAYRDVNRNGRYDMADRPFAGLEAVLTRPDGSTVLKTSNLAGFTNFPMSSRGIWSAVRHEGEHRIEIHAPPGWNVSSPESVQVRSFRRLVGSPAGLIIDRTLNPVGVMPRLFVRGHVEPGTTLKIEGPGGETPTVTVAADGGFGWEASPGEWSLQVTTPAGRRTNRVIPVKDAPVVVSRVAADAAPPPLPISGLANFDTLTPSDTLYEVPNGYVGLNWHNWVAAHQKFYGGLGYVNGTVSGEYMAYNSSGHPARIESERPFDLVRMHLAVAWPEAEKHDLLVRAWRADQLVHEER
ncbi:MAG: hypothetical protein JNN01_02020, partial [Opitutaceae bacterium]|nr:hypothetical protein [Opitutaceae bacterium]